jgi:hypothetical protein
MAERLRRDSPMDSLTEARRVVLSDLAEHPAHGDGQSLTAGAAAAECAPPPFQTACCVDWTMPVSLLLSSQAALAAAFELEFWPGAPASCAVAAVPRGTVPSAQVRGGEPRRRHIQRHVSAAERCVLRRRQCHCCAVRRATWQRRRGQQRRRRFCGGRKQQRRGTLRRSRQGAPAQRARQGRLSARGLRAGGLTH